MSPTTVPALRLSLSFVFKHTRSKNRDTRKLWPRISSNQSNLYQIKLMQPCCIINKKYSATEAAHAWSPCVKRKCTLLNVSWEIRLSIEKSGKRSFIQGFNWRLGNPFAQVYLRHPSLTTASPVCCVIKKSRGLLSSDFEQGKVTFLESYCSTAP